MYLDSSKGLSVQKFRKRASRNGGKRLNDVQPILFTKAGTHIVLFIKTSINIVNIYRSSGAER